MKGNEFNLSPREWRAKNKINEVRYNVPALNDLKDNYYNIADELADIVVNIDHVASNPDGRDWEEDNLGKDELNKEIKIFKQIQKLFDKSKLGKVL